MVTITQDRAHRQIQAGEGRIRQRGQQGSSGIYGLLCLVNLEGGTRRQDGAAKSSRSEKLEDGRGRPRVKRWRLQQLVVCSERRCEVGAADGGVL